MNGNDPYLERKQSLQAIDPSPEEESPQAASEKDGYFPPPASASALGLRTHNTAYYLQITQRYSSITFTAFLAAHIRSTSLLPLALGAPQASKYLLLFRPYYQSWPVAEPLLVLAPLALHITSGIALRVHRRRVLLKHYGFYDADALGDPDKEKGGLRWSDRSGSGLSKKGGAPWPKLTWTACAGYMAVPLVAGHAALTRLLPLYVDGGSSSIGLDYISHGVAIAPVLGYLGFTMLVGVVGSHVVWGWAKWTGWAPDEAVEGEDSSSLSRKKRRFLGVWTVTGMVVGAWLAGGLGVVGRDGRASGWVGGVYDEIYRAVPFLGRWV